MSCAGVEESGARGSEGDVLLEPEQVGGDWGCEICGCVDEDGDVGAVERKWRAEGWDFGGDWCED